MAEYSGTESPDAGQSPYRSPSAAVGGVAGDGADLMEAFIGPKNTSFYERAFAAIQANGNLMSWHWPACLVTWFWLAYRKMWAWFFIYWLVWPFVVLLFAGLAGFAHPYLTIFVYFAGYFIVPPLFANRLYYRHANKKISRAQFASPDASAQALEAARLGGTSNIVIIMIPALVILVGILAAIAIPAYQDYTIRAQVSQGLSLSAGAKAAVSGYYEDNGYPPDDNAAAGLAEPEEISGNYVESVRVDAGSITVTYGNSANQTIAGAELHLVPEMSDRSLEWECFSPTIVPKHLPSACR